MNRAMLMTAGQIASYDQFKQVMLQSGYFRDNPTTHFTYVHGRKEEGEEEEEGEERGRKKTREEGRARER